MGDVLSILLDLGKWLNSFLVKEEGGFRLGWALEALIDVGVGKTGWFVDWGKGEERGTRRKIRQDTESQQQQPYKYVIIFTRTVWSTPSAGPSVLPSDSVSILGFPSLLFHSEYIFLFLISSNYWSQLLYLTFSAETITISLKLPWSLTTNPQISCKNIHLWLLPCLIILPHQHLAFYLHSGSYSFLPPQRPHVTDYPFFFFYLKSLLFLGSFPSAFNDVQNFLIV